VSRVFEAEACSTSLRCFDIAERLAAGRARATDAGRMKLPSRASKQRRKGRIAAAGSNLQAGSILTTATWPPMALKKATAAAWS